MPCDIERIIIDEGFVKKGRHKDVDVGKSKRTHALLTSMMRNGKMVNHNTNEKKFEEISRLEIFHLLQLLCVF